jgi:hypothetical protein
VLGIMRNWHAFSLLAGCDASHGLVAEVAKMMEITSLELEGKEMLEIEPSMTWRLRNAKESMQGLQRKSIWLGQSERFRRLDEAARGTGILMLSFSDQETVRASNSAYERFFFGPGELFETMMRRKALPIFLHPSLVCPEDRESFMETVFKLYFARDIPATQTHLLKLVGRDGKIHLFLLRVHHSKRAGGDGGEMEEDFVLYLEKAPPSRHITSRPSANLQITQNFRHVSFQERLVGGGIGDGGVGTAAGDDIEGPAPPSASAAATPPLAYLPMLPSVGCPSPLDEVAGGGGEEEQIVQEKAADIFNLPAERLRRPLESNSAPSSSPSPPLELMATANEEVDALLDIGTVAGAGDEEKSHNWCVWEEKEGGNYQGDEEDGNDEGCYFDDMLSVPVLGAGVLPRIFEDEERLEE